MQNSRVILKSVFLKGVLCGILTSSALLLWINIGSILYERNRARPLPLFNHLCASINMSSSIVFNDSFTYQTLSDSVLDNTDSATFLPTLTTANDG